MICRRSCHCGPATEKTPSPRAERARAIRSPFFSRDRIPEKLPHLRIASVHGIDDQSICPEETCGNSVNNPLTEVKTLTVAEGLGDDLVAVGGQRLPREILESGLGMGLPARFQGPPALECAEKPRGHMGIEAIDLECLVGQQRDSPRRRRD